MYKVTFRVIHLVKAGLLGTLLWMLVPAWSAVPSAPVQTPAYLADHYPDAITSSKSSSASKTNAVAVDLSSELPSFFEIVGSLGFVLILIYLLAKGVKRWQVGSGLSGSNETESAIRVLEKNYIDNRHGLAVVELGGKIYYLGLGDNVTLLGQVSDDNEIERIRALAPSGGSFQAFPKQMEKVTDYLRRNQVEKSTNTLKDEANAIRGKSRKLRSPRTEKK